jgi:hypothetical protein
MPPRYTTNAIYERLKRTQDLVYRYLFIENNNWVLIYGSEQNLPQLILIASANLPALDCPLTAFELSCISILGALNVPLRLLRFNEGRFQDGVSISNRENTGVEIIATDRLHAELFAHYNLPLDPRAATKPVNDATSSDFHVWQRNFLSGRLKVADVDLIEYDNENHIRRLFELKRSYIALGTWQPYPADYPNFVLIRRTFPLEIPIYILYNLYTRTPRVENITNIRVFRIDNDIPQIVSISHSEPHNYNFTFEMIFPSR